MIELTQGQLKIFLDAFWSAFSVAFILFFICEIIKILTRNNIVVKNFLDFITTLFLGLFYFGTSIRLNYGQFRFYIFFAFLCGILVNFCIFKYIFSKYIAKTINLMYNKNIKIKKERGTRFYGRNKIKK
jgi:hypothetical protein